MIALLMKFGTVSYGHNTNLLMSWNLKASYPFGAKFGQFVQIGSMLKSSLELSDLSEETGGGEWCE